MSKWRKLIFHQDAHVTYTELSWSETSASIALSRSTIPVPAKEKSIISLRYFVQY